MPAYSPIVKILESDGVSASASFPSGIIPTGLWCASQFALRSRKGCAGGQLVLPGHVRNPTKGSGRQFVRFYHSSGAAIYTGRIEAVGRTIDGSQHTYDLRSPWADLEGASTYERVVLGTDGDEAGIDTIAEIVNWYITNRIEPTMPYAAGNIAACTQVVSKFVIEADMSPDIVFEALANMAGGADGQIWVYGIDPNLEIYFQPLDPDGDTVDYEIGTLANPLPSGDEKVNGKYIGNRLIVSGGVDTAADSSERAMRRHYPKAAGSSALWTASQATYGQKKPRIAAVGMLSRETDFDLFAEGWAGLYANPGIRVQSTWKEHMSAVPAFPWETMAMYKDVSRGTLGGPEMISQMDFEFGDGLISQATLGNDSDQKGASKYAPGDDRDYVQDALSSMLTDPFSIPEATDELPPYDEAPGADGGGSGSGIVVFNSGWAYNEPELL